MNIIAHLQFGDNVTGLYSKEYLVVGCRTHVSRSHNSYHPDSSPKCEAIEVTVVAPTKEDLYLYEWYLCNEKASGCLKFDIDDVRQSEGETVCRNLHFDGAQCFSIHENYDIQSSSRRLLTLHITADCLTANDVSIGEEPEDTFSF